MASVDIHNSVSQVLALDPVIIATDITTNGNDVDMNDINGFESLEFIMTVGLWTDGDYTLALEESDDGMAWAAVAAANVIGTATTLSADNLTDRLGYVGKKQFARATVVSATTTTGATVTVIAVRSDARHKPTA